MARRGPILTEVLRKAWQGTFKTQSNFAREHHAVIAMAASDGLITTKVATGLYGNNWLITSAGMSKLKVMEGK